MQKRVCIGVLAALLVGCGGDDNGNASPEDVRNYIHYTNLDSSGFPWHAVNHPDGIADGQLKRWQGLIPVKLNGSAVAASALDEIERRLNKTLFDRTSLNGLADADINHGLIVSEYTSIDGYYQASCGNVGYAPSQFSYPSSGGHHGALGFYSESGDISAKLYVNIGSSRCAPRVDIAIHEFGHALGLGDHFKGFGIGPAINENFWKVLASIYANEAGTSKDQLVIVLP